MNRASKLDRVGARRRLKAVLGAGLLGLALAPWTRLAQAAWAPEGRQRIVATLADGARVELGTVAFTPGEGGAVRFQVSLHTERFTDHFLSMREFKCLEGARELSCHVPYPYPQPGTVAPGQWAWLEHSLLFFYKAPGDFGAKLWNGLYFEMKATAEGLVGTPRAVDLNQIAAPPADARPPFGPMQRHEMPPEARWIRSLRIE